MTTGASMADSDSAQDVLGNVDEMRNVRQIPVPAIIVLKSCYVSKKIPSNGRFAFTLRTLTKEMS